jgi:hypothetical protein
MQPLAADDGGADARMDGLVYSASCVANKDSVSLRGGGVERIGRRVLGRGVRVRREEGRSLCCGWLWREDRLAWVSVS